MIPITDQYYLYELRDQETDKEFLIAHTRGQRRLRETEQTFGGILKELNRNKTKTSKKRLFLECVYYA
jgi:ribosomal protein L44E